MKKKMKPLYWNFDGLDVTFQGAAPLEFVDYLETAKIEAQRQRIPILIEWKRQPMHVAESGARGGYAYRCDTGPTGATWFFSRNQDAKNWNIRASVKSDALASQGLGRIRAALYRFLESLGAIIQATSISRVDYCVDFLASDIEASIGKTFVLDPVAFVMHSHTSRNDYDELGGIQMHGVSGTYTSVTCGRMPGRQIIIYNKTREIISHRKSQWWSHWNRARQARNLPPLNGTETVWRVELRAGKAHLKNRYGISSWIEFDNKIGDLFCSATEAIRYTTTDAADTQRCRWPNHPIWKAVKATIQNDLAEMSIGACPENVKDVLRSELIAVSEAQIMGLIATWVHAHSLPSNANAIAEAFKVMVCRYITNEPMRFQRSQQRAANKYHFIDHVSGP